jgi:mono/diheme cytochrome c family protein
MRSELEIPVPSCWCPTDVADTEDAGDAPAVMAAAAAELEAELPGARPSVGAYQRCAGCHGKAAYGCGW